MHYFRYDPCCKPGRNLELYDLNPSGEAFLLLGCCRRWDWWGYMQDHYWWEFFSFLASLHPYSSSCVLTLNCGSLRWPPIVYFHARDILFSFSLTLAAFGFFPLLSSFYHILNNLSKIFPMLGYGSLTIDVMSLRIFRPDYTTNPCPRCITVSLHLIRRASRLVDSLFYW